MAQFELPQRIRVKRVVHFGRRGEHVLARVEETNIQAVGGKEVHVRHDVLGVMQARFLRGGVTYAGVELICDRARKYGG